MRLLRQFVVTLFRLLVAALAFGGTYRSWTLAAPTRWLYFTTLTTVLVGLVFVWAAMATLLRGIQPWPWLKGLVTVSDIITGIVGTFVLGRPDIAHNPRTFGLIPEAYVIHVIVPLLVLADFLLNDPHRLYRWHYLLSWLLFPLVWFGAVLLHARVRPSEGISGNPGDHNPYPYHFLDLPALGARQFWIDVGLVALGFVLIELVVIGLDRLLPGSAILDTGEKFASAREPARETRR